MNTVTYPYETKHIWQSSDWQYKQSNQVELYSKKEQHDMSYLYHLDYHQYIQHKFRYSP
jgi:hypothetical protein